MQSMDLTANDSYGKMVVIRGVMTLNRDILLVNDPLTYVHLFILLVNRIHSCCSSSCVTNTSTGSPTSLKRMNW